MKYCRSRWLCHLAIIHLLCVLGLNADPYRDDLDKDLAQHVAAQRGQAYSAQDFKNQSTFILGGADEASVLSAFVSQGLSNVSYEQSLSSTLEPTGYSPVTQQVTASCKSMQDWWYKTTHAPFSHSVSKGDGGMAVMWVKLLDNPDEMDFGKPKVLRTISPSF